MKKFVFLLGILFVCNTSLFTVRIKKPTTGPKLSQDVIALQKDVIALQKDVISLQQENGKLKEENNNLRKQLTQKEAAPGAPSQEHLTKAHAIADNTIAILQKVRNEEHADDEKIIQLQGKARNLDDEVRRLTLENLKLKQQRPK